MRKFLFIFFLIPTIVCGFFIFAHPVNAVAPRIDSLFPPSGPPNTILKIYGNNFKTDVLDNYVEIYRPYKYDPLTGEGKTGGRCLLFPESASESELEVDLSECVVLTDPLAVGEWEVSVYTANSVISPESNILSFNVTPVPAGGTPHINEINPDFHVPEYSRIIKIIGYNFNSSDASKNKAVFKKGSLTKEKIGGDVFGSTQFSVEIGALFFSKAEQGEWQVYVYSYNEGSGDWLESNNYKILTVSTHCGGTIFCCLSGTECTTGQIDGTDCAQCCVDSANCKVVGEEPTCSGGDGCKSGCLSPGDPDCSCAQNGGTWCGAGKNCTGPTLNASDHPKAECCQDATDCPGGGGEDGKVTPSTCDTCPEDQRGGLVPCGKSCDDPNTDWNECDPCTFCHLFLMFNIIIKFVMSKLVPILAVLMLIIGGIMYFFAGASPQALSQAKSIITSVAIGLAIIFCAWIIINTVLVQSGIVKAESILKWYEISCGVE